MNAPMHLRMPRSTRYLKYTPSRLPERLARRGRAAESEREGAGEGGS
jgi:hypothetical protein